MIGRLRISRASCLTGLSMAFAMGAAHAQTFDPPQGCTGLLTVQSKSCLVTHVWTCEGDAEGEKWIALFNRVGPFNIRKVDEDFQWLETYYAQDGKVETMVVPANDPPNRVPEEASGDRDLSAHQANLYDLNAKYVDVLSLEETLALL